MKQRSFLMILLSGFLVCTAGLAADEKNISVPSGTPHQAENIVRGTVRQFSDARSLADIEFDRAKESFTKIPEKVQKKAEDAVKDAAQKAVDQAVDQMKKQPSAVSAPAAAQAANVPATPVSTAPAAPAAKTEKR